MKKTTKGIFGLSLTAMALMSFALPAAAEEGTPATASKQTDGKASFVPQSGNIDPIKPGTNDKIEVDGGNTDPVKVGAVQLIRIPDFDFGTNETSINSQEYAALNEKYKNAGGSEKYAIPHFVQVGDVSGVQGTKWKVTVEQDGLFKAGEHTLKGTRINIYDQTLTNNVHSANVADVVTGLSIPGNNAAFIPVKGTDSVGAIPVLASKGGKTDATTTNGTISSVVFASGYDASDYGATGPGADSKNEDVRLSVPQSDGVQTKSYSTKLSWTLTVEP